MTNAGNGYGFFQGDRESHDPTGDITKKIRVNVPYFEEDDNGLEKDVVNIS